VSELPNYPFARGSLVDQRGFPIKLSRLCCIDKLYERQLAASAERRHTTNQFDDLKIPTGKRQTEINAERALLINGTSNQDIQLVHAGRKCGEALTIGLPAADTEQRFSAGILVGNDPGTVDDNNGGTEVFKNDVCRAPRI